MMTVEHALATRKGGGRNGSASEGRGGGERKRREEGGEGSSKRLMQRQVRQGEGRREQVGKASRTEEGRGIGETLECRGFSNVLRRS